MYYSNYEKKYKLLKTGKKKHYISETNALRIVRYLYYPTGQPKPGRSINDALAKMYGLHKQRLRYARRKRAISEMTLTGRHRHAPRRILKEKKIRRVVRRYKKAPEITEKELPEYRGIKPTIQMRYHINRRQTRLYAGAYKIHLTKGDGSPLNNNFVITKPSEITEKVEWMTKHIISKSVLQIALKLREKHGMTPTWQVGGQVGYVWVRKHQKIKTVQADECGKNVDVVKLHRKDFEELIIETFKRELLDAIRENVSKDENVFKSGEKTFKLVQITSFTVKLFTTSEKLTPKQKTYGRTVGIYPRQQQEASWKNR